MLDLYIVVGETCVKEVGSGLEISRDVHWIFNAKSEEEAKKKISELKWINIFSLYKIEKAIPIPRHPKL